METRMLDLILQFNRQKILVIGDFMLDVYIHGEGNRISPEAPVAVVDVQNINRHLGGAGNVAANISSLGAEVYFCSVVGEDIFEEQVKPLLSLNNISAKYLVHDEKRKTEIKTRVVAQQHTIVRFDSGDKTPISETSETLLLDLLEEAYQTCDAVIIADYEKGVITNAVINTIYELQKRHPKFIAIDSKRLSIFNRLKPSLVKPNYKQAISLTEIEASSERIKQVMSICSKLYKRTGASLIAVTLDADGAVWIEDGKKPIHRPTKPISNAEVCGAGDTYISASTLALISGADKLLAANIAGIAASVVVEKTDTAVCEVSEIIERFNGGVKIINNREILASLALQLRKNSKRIIFTNGCFDILHCGHTHYLQEAKALGDVLVVGINTDASIRRLKGSSRPINLLEDRMDVLAAFSCIDYIIPFGDVDDQDNPSELIRTIKPNVVVKGEDYKNKELPEIKVIEEIAAKMVLLPFTYGKSTTNIIRRIQNKPLGNISNLKAL